MLDVAELKEQPSVATPLKALSVGLLHQFDRLLGFLEVEELVELADQVLQRRLLLQHEHDLLEAHLYLLLNVGLALLAVLVSAQTPLADEVVEAIRGNADIDFVKPGVDL